MDGWTVGVIDADLLPSLLEILNLSAFVQTHEAIFWHENTRMVNAAMSFKLDLRKRSSKYKDIIKMSDPGVITSTNIKNYAVVTELVTI